MKKAALHNLGCKVNAYETEAMQQMLEEAGYEIVPFSEKADVYVINTCSVTNMADRKSRQMLHRAKKRNPDAAVVAAGCYVQTKEDEAKCDEAIDILIGNNQKKELVERLDAFFAGRGEKVEAVVDINHEKQAFEELTLDHAAEHTRAFIKVQDGCNQFCSYCIIPYARGRVRSRNVQNVLEEVKRLAASGYQEVVLTGIHLSSYGIDCGESLLHLIQMVHQVEGIRRIRLGSLEPRIVTETFAEELAKRNDCQCTVTGESIGQVSSQTVFSLAVINDVSTLPVFRPCIGLDKQEIVDISEKIGTYETSILPYEDCCTTFVAKHPVTKPILSAIEKSEAKLAGIIEPLYEKALESVETVMCRAQR